LVGPAGTAGAADRPGTQPEARAVAVQPADRGRNPGSGGDRRAGDGGRAGGPGRPRLPPIEAAFFVLFLAEYGLRLAVAWFNPLDGSARR
jgi:hypothetical protein